MARIKHSRPRRASATLQPTTAAAAGPSKLLWCSSNSTRAAPGTMCGNAAADAPGRVAIAVRSHGCFIDGTHETREDLPPLSSQNPQPVQQRAVPLASPPPLDGGVVTAQLQDSEERRWQQQPKKQHWDEPCLSQLASGAGGPAQVTTPWQCPQHGSDDCAACSRQHLHDQPLSKAVTGT